MGTNKLGDFYSIDRTSEVKRAVFRKRRRGKSKVHTLSLGQCELLGNDMVLATKEREKEGNSAVSRKVV